MGNTAAQLSPEAYSFFVWSCSKQNVSKYALLVKDKENKVVPVHAMKAYSRNRSSAPLLNHDTR
jgi:hypothetical protein